MFLYYFILIVFDIFQVYLIENIYVECVFSILFVNDFGIWFFVWVVVGNFFRLLLMFVVWDFDG